MGNECNFNKFKEPLKSSLIEAYNIMINPKFDKSDRWYVASNVYYDIKDAYKFKEISLDDFSNLKEYFWGLVE